MMEWRVVPAREGLGILEVVGELPAAEEEFCRACGDGPTWPVAVTPAARRSVPQAPRGDSRGRWR